MVEDGPERYEHELYRRAEEGAWRYFEMHASQRMQLVSFFFAGAAFLTGGYAASLNADLPLLAAVIALLGAVLSFFFLRLESRTRELVKLAEVALKSLQQQLSEATGIRALEILKAADKSAGPRGHKPRILRLRTYGDIIPSLYMVAMGAFILGTIAAVIVWCR
ncbi:MAG: hypothetical protein AMXMBFR23_17790 [Chloroflexota bacterium]